MLVSRLGFEPRTQGLKVRGDAVHGVHWPASPSTSRAAAVHLVHSVGPDDLAVAVNEAVSERARFIGVRVEGIEEAYSCVCGAALHPTCRLMPRWPDPGLRWCAPASRVAAVSRSS